MGKAAVAVTAIFSLAGLAGCNASNGHTVVTAISLVPEGVTIAQNGTLSVAVTVGPVDPSSAVHLSVTGAPDGMQTSFSAVSFSGTNASSTLTLSPAATPPATGSYDLTVEAKSDNVDSLQDLPVRVDEALSVLLGIVVNTVYPVDQGDYGISYQVQATAYGSQAPVSTGVPVTIKLEPVAYQKGTMSFSQSAHFWLPGHTIATNDPDIDSTTFGCKNEDLNGNGILDPGEDYNGNGALDPEAGLPAPVQATLDEQGEVNGVYSYPKIDAEWLSVSMSATVEGVTISSKPWIPWAMDSDIDNPAVAPPNATSPFGTAANCITPN
jgi:hypothetical protein